MDSITQFALGAALGELVAGRKAGNKAVFWGGLAGTIPDLDILFNPLYTDLEKLSLHRGFSHSLVFAFLTAPLLAWMVHRLYRNKKEISYRDWLRLFFLGIFTHPLLDSFTLYGTQLFLPFSDYRVAINSISIVDPLYTLPLLIGTGTAMALRRNALIRSQRWNRAGLYLSSAYLAFTLLNKVYLDHIFEKSLQAQHIHPTQVMSNPVLFNNVLWYAVAKDDSMCYIGYYSHLQESERVHFESFPRNEALTGEIRDREGLEKLRWFSKEYYVMDKVNDTLCFFDIRFGKTDLRSVQGNEKTFVFYFKLTEPKARPLVIRQYVSGKDMKFSEFMKQIFSRIFHEF